MAVFNTTIFWKTSNPQHTCNDSLSTWIKSWAYIHVLSIHMHYKMLTVMQLQPRVPQKGRHKTNSMQKLAAAYIHVLNTTNK